MFEAELNGEPVVVKFSRLYGQAAHTLLTKNHLASNLIFYEKIVFMHEIWITISSHVVYYSTMNTLQHYCNTLNSIKGVTRDE